MRSNATARSFSSPDWLAVGVACFLLLYDAIFSGSCLLTLVIGPFWLLQAIFGNWRRRSEYRHYTRRFIFPAVTIAVILVSAYLQSRIASSNATRIIRACKEYKAEYGEYPDDLGRLVPKYLSCVPCGGVLPQRFEELHVL